MKVGLGDLARDTVSGFAGIAFARTEYISGCARIGLQAPASDDGKIPEPQYFDEPMLEVEKVAVVAARPTDNGGPRSAPLQHSAPTR